MILSLLIFLVKSSMPCTSSRPWENICYMFFQYFLFIQKFVNIAVIYMLVIVYFTGFIMILYQVMEKSISCWFIILTPSGPGFLSFPRTGGRADSAPLHFLKTTNPITKILYMVIDQPIKYEHFKVWMVCWRQQLLITSSIKQNMV